MLWQIWHMDFIILETPFLETFVKIFWSWQLDTPEKVNKSFVRNAIMEVITELKGIDDLLESTRQEIHFDSDRKGVLGSPDLANTIFLKISSASIFIADVTFVAERIITDNSTLDGENTAKITKKYINSNVAIELGYALRALTDRNILMIMNTFYGNRDFLPFDVKHKAGPITYCLSDTATKTERKKQFAILKEKLLSFIREYIDFAELTKSAEDRRVLSEKLRLCKEVNVRGKERWKFFESYDTLVFSNIEPRSRLSYSYNYYIYVRVIPLTIPKIPISNNKLEEIETFKSLTIDSMTKLYRVSKNKYGIILYSEEQDTRNNKQVCLNSLSQVFRNGEIWGYLTSPRFTTSEGNIIQTHLSVSDMEKVISTLLESYVKTINNILEISPPYAVVIGSHGLNDATLRVNKIDKDHDFGSFIESTFEIDDILTEANSTEVESLLGRLFEKLFENTNYPRPGHLLRSTIRNTG